MKRNKTRIITAITILMLTLSLMMNIGIDVWAEEPVLSAEQDELGGEIDDSDAENATEGGEISQNVSENLTDNGDNNTIGGEMPLGNEQNSEESGDYEENIFEEIYTTIELNADKIFSILAFVGTLIVSVGYKSGLLPLLRDALSKLKGAIDGVKAEGEQSKAHTDERLGEISSAVESISEELREMRWQYESYDEILRERKSIRLILQGQIDMLYSIFMTSALPQYQKDEIGERIGQMREELKSYEYSEKN